MRGLFLAMTLLAAAPAWAQVQSRPTEPPIVTAENEQWYRAGRTAADWRGRLLSGRRRACSSTATRWCAPPTINGVPLYADTTVEPYSMVFVPVSRGRDAAVRAAAARRSGRNDRQPHAVVSGRGGVRVDYRGPLMAAVSPTNLPQPIGAIDAFTDAPCQTSGAGAVRYPGTSRR